MARRLLASGFVLAATVATLQPRAVAHEEVPGTSNVVDEVDPALPGVMVEVVVSAADQLVVENTTETPLAVLDDDGEPFLRIGAGIVEANIASATWYESNSPTGTVKLPPSVHDGAAATWVKVASTPSWGWFDHRLHRRTLTALREAGVIETWKIPMRFGEQPVEVRGHRAYERPAGRFLTTIDRVTHDFLTAQVVDGTIPALLLRVQGDHEVVILGRGADTVAVITPGGVDVNEASPIWRITAGARGDAPAGPVGGDEPVRLTRESDAAQLTWLEPRAQYRAKAPPNEIEAAGERVTLQRWTVPLRVDGAAASIEGHVEWVPVASTDGAPSNASDPPLGPILAASAALAIVLWALARGRTPAKAHRTGERGRGMRRG